MGRHTIFVDDGAPENSITMVGVQAHHHAMSCASFPDVEIEHSLTRMGMRQSSAPIATDLRLFNVD
jgi:hypothetical protein